MLIRSDSASRDALYDWITIIRYTAQFSSSSSSSSPSSSSSSSSSSSTSFSPSLNSSTIHCTSYSLSCYFPPMILLILLGRPNCNRNSKGPAGRRPRHPIIASFIATFTEFLHNFPHFPPPLRSFFFPIGLVFPPILRPWSLLNGVTLKIAITILKMFDWISTMMIVMKNVATRPSRGRLIHTIFFFDSDRSNHFADYASMIKFTKHFSKKKKTSQQGIDRLPSLKSGNWANDIDTSWLRCCCCCFLLNFTFYADWL